MSAEIDVIICLYLKYTLWFELVFNHKNTSFNLEFFILNICHTTFYFALQVPMAEAMEKFTLDFNCRTILIDVVREMDRVDVKEMSRDTSGTRAFSQFLVEVAERLPEQLQPCLVLLMKHLVSHLHTYSMV